MYICGARIASYNVLQDKYSTDMPYSILGGNVTEDKCQSDFGHSNSVTLVTLQLLFCMTSFRRHFISHSTPVPGKAQTPHRDSLLGFRVCPGLYLTNQYCFVIKKNTSCLGFLPPPFSLTHPGSLLVHWMSKSVSDYHLVY